MLSYIKPIKGIDFKELKKKYYITLDQSILKYNFTKLYLTFFCGTQKYLISQNWLSHFQDI